MWPNIHGLHYASQWGAIKKFDSVSEELRLFFPLSLQLGETNRPVMQQWEAVNAKRIIREEGSGEEEEEEGGRQKKWSGIEKEKARYS